MRAEPARLWHRIDQPRKRRAACKREIAALGEIRLRNRRRIEARNRARKARRSEAGGEHHMARGDLCRCIAADRQHDRAAADFAALERRAEGERGAMGLGIALQGEHESMAVDDARRGRQQADMAGERRLQPRQIGAFEQREVFDAIGFGAGFDRQNLRALRLVGGDENLAAAPERHAMIFAEAIEHLPSLDAGPRLQRSRRIIEAGMDDLAVARGYAAADAALRLDDDDLASGHGERAADGEPDHTGADDDAIDIRCAHPAPFPSLFRPR